MDPMTEFSQKYKFEGKVDFLGLAQASASHTNKTIPQEKGHVKVEKALSHFPTGLESASVI